MTSLARGRWTIVSTVSDTVIVVGDSATWSGALDGAVAVCGSHGGASAVEHAVRSGAKALVVNDAGVGKDDAGISGLEYAERHGVAAVTVSHLSARIGDGLDTYAEGVVSHLNRSAADAGVEAGMATADAAHLLAKARSEAVGPIGEAPVARSQVVLAAGHPPAIGIDSNADADASVAGAILITGSHGGVVGGRAVSHAVAAAFFNDAGVGKDAAGISRLPRLDAEGIPAGTVSYESARIGDARDTFASGLLSFVNETGAAAGFTVGTPVRNAVASLQGGSR
jgi:hypothetical protein